MAEYSIPKGTRDFAPEEMKRREYVMSAVKKVFEKYGFLPLETPAIEFLDTLKSKYGEDEKLIWSFKDLGGRDVALRYDLTVPLARYVAMNKNIPKPFKRYQIGRVWRYDQPQKGRYREFWQCDVDTLGSKSPAADAEIIAVIYDALTALGFKGFTIRINNRKLMDCVFLEMGALSDQLKDIYVSVDKLDKIGVPGVRKEMSDRGIDAAVVDKILELIQINGKPDYVLSRVEQYVKAKDSKEALEETKRFFQFLAMSSVPMASYMFDLSLARGLDYYTSFVFETSVAGGAGSITGGGRYDGLIGRFAGGDVPATGTSLGFERIVDLMAEKSMFPSLGANIKAFIANVGDETLGEALRIASELRAAGISAETDVMGRSLGKQMDYAATKNVAFCVIVGPRDMKEKKAVLRNMETGKETRVDLKNVVEMLRAA